MSDTDENKIPLSEAVKLLQTIQNQPVVGPMNAIELDKFKRLTAADWEQAWKDYRAGWRNELFRGGSGQSQPWQA
jgi:hypothetical protein